MERLTIFLFHIAVSVLLMRLVWTSPILDLMTFLAIGTLFFANEATNLQYG